MLAAELLRDTLGAPLPRFTEARIESAECTELVPIASNDARSVIWARVEFVRSYVAKGKQEAKLEGALEAKG